MTKTIDLQPRTNEVLEASFDVSALEGLYDLSAAIWIAQARIAPSAASVAIAFDVVGPIGGSILLTVSAERMKDLEGDYPWDLVFVIDGVPRVACAGTTSVVPGISR